LIAFGPVIINGNDLLTHRLASSSVGLVRAASLVLSHGADERELLRMIQ
jgi:hypothetical protein